MTDKEENIPKLTPAAEEALGFGENAAHETKTQVPLRLEHKPSTIFSSSKPIFESVQPDIA